MRKQFFLLCGVALSSVFASASAQAQLLLFELSGARNATFTLNTSNPSSFTTSALIGDQIFFNNVAGTFGGSAGTASTITFGSNLITPFEIVGTSLGFTQLIGPDLFTGSGANPMFSLGTFNLSGGFTSGASTLTISRATVAAAVPESETWAMMLIGFGAMGVAMRRRRRTQLLVQAA